MGFETGTGEGDESSTAAGAAADGRDEDAAEPVTCVSEDGCVLVDLLTGAVFNKALVVDVAMSCWGLVVVSTVTAV